MPAWDKLQHYLNANTVWAFVDDQTAFRFHVAGELIDDEFFFELYGPIESRPIRYQNLIRDIMLRFDYSNWHNSLESGASFEGWSSLGDVPFYL